MLTTIVALGVVIVGIGISIEMFNRGRQQFAGLLSSWAVYLLLIEVWQVQIWKIALLILLLLVEGIVLWQFTRGKNGHRF